MIRTAPLGDHEMAWIVTRQKLKRGLANTRQHLAFACPRFRIPAMSYQTPLFELRDGIAFVTVNRPDKLNALNDKGMLDLGNAPNAWPTDPKTKAPSPPAPAPKPSVAGP